MFQYFILDLVHLTEVTIWFCMIRNSIPDFGVDVMAEALATAKPIYKIPIIPLPSSGQYRHQDHHELKDYRSKVSLFLSKCPL